MTSEKGPGTAWIGRTWAYALGLWLGGIWVWDCLFIWPIWALTQKHPPVAGAVAYLVLVGAALIWATYRGRRLGVRFGDRGVVVCNWLRTRRASWAEVSSFADGTTNGRSWALTVMLRDGRGITATATSSRPGRPEFLIAARQAAARHGVPATLTGVAAERPRAWLDAAGEARRHRAVFAGWLAGSVLAVAAAVPLLWWGRTHSDAHHPGNYYPAGFAGALAVAGLAATLVAWAARKHSLRPQPAPAQDHPGEGDWFAVRFTVPLSSRPRYAPGLITRTEPRPGGLMLCYFFAPIDTTAPTPGTRQPTPGQLRGLRAADAVLIQRLDGLAPNWPRLGRAERWDRAAWPVPAFGRVDKKTRQSYLDIYDDDLRFLGQETTGRAALAGLPPSELLTPAGAEAAMADLPRTPPGTVSVRRGDRIRCVECGTTMSKARPCPRCGAPVPGHPPGDARRMQPGIQKAAKLAKTLLAWTGAVLLNFFALFLGTGFVVTAISEGSPAQEGPNYVPLWACAFIAITCSIVPAVTVVILVRRRRDRRAEASDLLVSGCTATRDPAVPAWIPRAGRRRLRRPQPAAGTHDSPQMRAFLALPIVNTMRTAGQARTVARARRSG